MKKLVILMIVFTCIFFASCSFDDIVYCPYCGSLGVVDSSDDYAYKCSNLFCGKKFYALNEKDIKDLEGKGMF